MKGKWVLLSKHKQPSSEEIKGWPKFSRHGPYWTSLHGPLGWWLWKLNRKNAAAPSADRQTGGKEEKK